MDRYNSASGEVPEQVVEYEEVLEEGQEYMEDESGGQYYEEYVQGVERAHTGPAKTAPVYYEQVIEEKPTNLRSAGTTLASIGNARGLGYAGGGGYYNQRVVQHFGNNPMLPLRQSQTPIIGYPRSKPVPTSMVYTPPSLLGARRDPPGTAAAANHPFLPNFLHLFPRKPAKTRKASTKKKPCNCNKSMCLKLYCDCFANGEFCLDCNCKDCHNNLEYEAERSRAIKSSLERNPTAFKPKIGVAAKAAGKTVDMERLHQRGCHCKKSNCLKNYCECYEAKVACTDRCKCQSCRNTEHDRHNKFKDKFSTTAGGLAQLAAAAAADTRGRSRSMDSDLDGSDMVVETAEEQQQRAHQQNPKTQPWFYMTEDVIEATTMCLVSQAQEFEQTMTEEELERSVLKEFGRCLEQIIESATSCLPQGSPQQQISSAAPAPSTSSLAQ